MHRHTHALTRTHTHTGTTTNKSDYIQYSVPGEGARAARPQPALSIDKQPFNAQSTYRDNFIPMVSAACSSVICV